MTRIPFRLLVLGIIAALTAVVMPASAQAATPYCGITWGSLAKAGPSAVDPASGQTLVDVRAGRHDCYDRLVLDIRGPALRTWQVRYVPQVIHDPRGDVVPLRGGAFLQIVVGATTYDENGRPTYDPSNDSELAPVAGFTTFRQVALAGSFEGLTTLGLGVRARLPFRVFTLDDIPGSASGTRLVVDVAHRW
jgi:hypothetical protein